MSNPDFGKFAGQIVEQTGHLRKTHPAHCLLIPERLKPRRSPARVPSTEAFPLAPCGRGARDEGDCPACSVACPARLECPVPSWQGVGQRLRWVSYLLNQSVPTHRPFCDRSPVQSQRVPSRPFLFPARCGWVQAKRRRAGVIAIFSGLFSVKQRVPSRCPGPAADPMPADRSEDFGLWTLDFGLWTRTNVSRRILLSLPPAADGSRSNAVELGRSSISPGFSR
jgi:hypothetical protein